MITHDFSALPPAGDTQAARRRLVFCAAQGLFRHAVAAEYGGFGNGFRDLVKAHEQLGRTGLDSGLILSINAHLWGALFPILQYGNTHQRQYLLPDLLSGAAIGGHAITEPQAGSDLNNLQAQAKRTPNGFTINGHKRYITNTPIADFLLVYAHLDNKLTAFIVRNDDPGVQFCTGPEVTGCNTATMGDVLLDNCSLPLERQLGKSGAGMMLMQHALELERAFVFAGLSGIMSWQLQQAVGYSRERRVSGFPLGKNQAVSHKLAIMKLRLESVRLWVNECARLKDSRQRITLASAQTKLYAAEAFLQSSLDTVQILGSCALEESSLYNRFVLDALASRLFSGSSEIQMNIIAALLGSGDGYKG
ncbi:MAG: acyl-CoA dehydrogenase family protein [Gammaproteobacteria bacterium]